MPKTKKLFDWEIYDENNELIDILTMTRNQMRDYQQAHPNYTISEISYHDGEDDTRESSSHKDGNIYSVCISRRRK